MQILNHWKSKTIVGLLALTLITPILPSIPTQAGTSKQTTYSNQIKDTQTTYKNSSQYKAKSPSPKLQINKKTITIGESKKSLIKKLGKANRIDPSEYGGEVHIYNKDYKNFVMVYLNGGKVSGYYTDAISFKALSLKPGMPITSINKALKKSYKLDSTLTYHAPGQYKATLLLDEIGTKKLTGILVLSDKLKKPNYKETIKAQERQVLDATNSIRIRHGLNQLKWSANAGKSARSHSKDMIKRNFFDHINPSGESPFDRMKKAGVSYTLAGENIIGGYGNGVLSSHVWFNSSAHRSNILNKEYEYLGVGFALGGSYGTYFTQNFYREY